MGLLHRIELSRNTVEIDDIVFVKPNYVAWTDWADFWKAVQDINEDFGLGEYDQEPVDDLC